MVVLVEDEFLVRALMTDVLSDAGFDVREAGQAQEALAIMEAQAADVSVLFTDIHMPGTMDGVALVHYVYDHWPNIRLLIASGRARVSADDLPPGCRFLAKPYDLQHTLDHVRDMARRP